MRNNRPRVLIVDDDTAIRDSCAQVLIKAGNVVETAENGQAGLGRLEAFQPDVVLVDLKMPGISGMDVLKAIERFDPNIVKAVITGYATIPMAVEAIKMGAYDFIAKPFSPDEIRLLVERGVEKRKLLLESEALRNEQERIRTNMILLVSHELRTPLAAAVQYLEVILAGLAGEISSEAKDLLNQSDIRLREMLDLIRRWLNLATMDSEKLAEKFSDIDPAEIAAATVALFKGSAEEKQIRLFLESSDPLPAMKGSKVALSEVFNNLISNAIKYNRPGGWVRVKLREKEEYVEIEISDNGIGIETTHQQRIFDEFYRVDGRRSSPIKGSGLGLSIAKKIVTAHGGSIDLKSQSGEGTTFRIRLPKAASGHR